ncbi:exocyst complex component 3-like isoform X1 [Asterias rubens]|uniref:exocyst complex component 3-like isoform X1 n=2 Tax=Asterias rubens TaxID=7604 RepID=UPI0014557350|nr:exocyst complex component 3-like isoform X1 [Asterias rubens]
MPGEQMEDHRGSENQSDNLLRNYQTLQYLEKSRDEILCQVHLKLANETEKEKKVRSESFSDVDVQSDLMFDQIKNVFDIMYKLVNDRDRELLKASVQIVDSEEKRDSDSMECSTSEHELFVSPKRPKRWRQKCLDIITTKIIERIKVVAPEPPSTSINNDSTWFLRHLTTARDNIQRDIDHAKTLSVCFSEEWNMLKTYASTYYVNLMSQMQESFSFDLNHKETVEVLSWMIFCRDRVFKCQDAECKACRIIGDLQNKYLKEKCEHIHKWMKNALEKDISDWYSQEKSRVTSDRKEAYFTEFPLLILKILEENVNQAKDISPELHKNLLSLCFQELDKTMESYAYYVKIYISGETPIAGNWRNFSIRGRNKERTRKTLKEPRPAFFVQYSTALLNNFDKISRCLQQMKKDSEGLCQPSMDQADDSGNNNNTGWRDDSIEKLLQKIKEQTRDCSLLLIPRICDDMSVDQSTVLTRNWLMGNEKESVDTICDVIRSYLSHLREPFCSVLVPAIGDDVVFGYMRGLLERRLKCDGKESDRLAVCDKLHRECDQLGEFLQEFVTKELEVSTRFDVVRKMADVIQATEEETIITNMVVISSKYPDIKQSHAKRLLKVRGGLTKTQISSIISSSLEMKRKTPTDGFGEKTIFSKLPTK